MKLRFGHPLRSLGVRQMRGGGGALLLTSRFLLRTTLALSDLHFGLALVRRAKGTQERGFGAARCLNSS